MLRTISVLSLLVGSIAVMPCYAVAQPLALGAATPGVCLFSRNAAMAASHAGVAGTERMQTIVAAVNAELNPQQQQILTDAKNTQAQKSSLSPAIFQQRGLALEQREQTFQQLQQLRNAQVQQTRVQVEQSISQAIDPFLDAATIAHRCSIVLERSNAYRFNAAMDLTDQVRTALDQKLAPIQFNLAPPESVQGRRPR